MRYYRTTTGVVMTTGSIIGTEITESEYFAEIQAAEERGAQKDIIIERTRPLTAEEVTAMLIRQQINGLTVDDNTALRMVEFYPQWKDLIGTTVDKAGFKFTHNGQLYKTIPEQHSFQADWVPGVGTESIYTRIDETHAGTLTDPIPYSGNMALEAGKYYSQSGAVYLCTRDTVNPVYNALADLVGLYVEKGE